MLKAESTQKSTTENAESTETQKGEYRLIRFAEARGHHYALCCGRSVRVLFSIPPGNEGQSCGGAAGGMRPSTISAPSEAASGMKIAE
jgi:hypothetical protein